MSVYEPHQSTFVFKLTSAAKIQPAIIGTEGQVTRWSRSTSNFYALIGQNLTSEVQIFLTEHFRHYGLLFMNTFYNVVNSIICCGKETRVLIVLNYRMSAICLPKL